MLVGRREDVEDAAAHRELTTPGDHVDARVGEVDEPHGEVGEVVAAAADGQGDRLQFGEAGGEGLQRGAHRGDDDDRMPRTILKALRLPVAQPAQGVDATPDRLGARAQSLVRQGLPGGELEDLGIRHEARHRIPQRFRIAPGRDDREECPWTLAGRQKCGKERRAETLDKGEIGAATRVLDGVFERAGAQKPGT